MTKVSKIQSGSEESDTEEQQDHEVEQLCLNEVFVAENDVA
jgi:hypothetical protein